MTAFKPGMRWLASFIVAAMFAPDPAIAGDGTGIDRLLAEARSLAKLIKRIDRSSAMAPVARFKASPLLHPNRVLYSKPIGRASRAYGIPEPLIAAVIKCESDWNHRAQSKANARGLMQILPQTAWGTFGVQSENLWNPAINISVGTAYLRLLANRYNGNTLNVIAAYNAGPTRVDRRRKLPRETRGYIRCVRRWHPVYERALK
jgi:soluble lytic murein transglycosylase-like protein